VRHLLIDEMTGREFTYLIWFSAGKEGEPLSQGTLDDSRQKADQQGKIWGKDEGFEEAKKDEPLYEPFEHAIKLALRLGRNTILDPRLVQPDPHKPNCNFNGHVQLKDWQGVQTKNGGNYKYAVTLKAILAELQPAEGARVGPPMRFLFVDPTAI